MRARAGSGCFLPWGGACLGQQEHSSAAATPACCPCTPAGCQAPRAVSRACQTCRKQQQQQQRIRRQPAQQQQQQPLSALPLPPDPGPPAGMAPQSAARPPGAALPPVCRQRRRRMIDNPGRRVAVDLVWQPPGRLLASIDHLTICPAVLCSVSSPCMPAVHSMPAHFILHRTDHPCNHPHKPGNRAEEESVLETRN